MTLIFIGSINSISTLPSQVVGWRVPGVTGADGVLPQRRVAPFAQDGIRRRILFLPEHVPDIVTRGDRSLLKTLSDTLVLPDSLKGYWVLTVRVVPPMVTDRGAYIATTIVLLSGDIMTVCCVSLGHPWLKLPVQHP